MSKSNNNDNNKRSAWSMVVDSVSAETKTSRLKQQELYRIFESIKTKNKRLFDEIADSANLDLPLLFSGSTSAPNASIFKPEGFKFDRITPMCWAAYNDDVEGLIWLSDAGADPAFPSIDGRDPLWISSMNSSNNAWEWLLDQTLRFDARTNDGKRTTRLIDAVTSSNVFAVRDLLSKKVNAEAVDWSGRNALHYNFLQSPYTDADQNIGRMLVDYGVPVDASDHEGVSPAALSNCEAQQALIEKSVLMRVVKDQYEQAQAQRQHLESIKPRIKPSEIDPTEPGLPQITKPQKPKRIF